MTVIDTPPSTPPVDLPAPGGWSIEWRGRTFHESELTGQHLATLALLTGSDDFAALDVDPRHGHQRLMSVLMAFLTVAAAREVGPEDGDVLAGVIAQAIDEVSSASVDELLGALTFG